MEITITYCDFCNPNCEINTRMGRGIVVYPEENAISDFDWKRMPDGKVMCIECQDEQ